MFSIYERTGSPFLVRVENARERDTTNVCKETFECFKFIHKIKFPSQIGWAYHISELHWFKVKWRRKYLVREMPFFARYPLQFKILSLFFILHVNSNSREIRWNTTSMDIIIALLWHIELCKCKASNERFALSFSSHTWRGIFLRRKKEDQCIIVLASIVDAEFLQ